MPAKRPNLDYYQSCAIPKHARKVDREALGVNRSEWCEKCGKPGDVERHHLRSRGAGGNDEPSNFLDLCRECHRAFHDGKIARGELMGIAAKRNNRTVEQAG